MARGIDRQEIFKDDLDRDDFVLRLATLARRRAFIVYAWVLMPNHVHLLLRTALEPLGRAMRSLLGGHAGRFNRRHGRVGHVFQNRFKSILCEEERYFLELVRYIHLNPIRGGLVAGIPGLDHFQYSGHSALIGLRENDWQATREVLIRFGVDGASARSRYRDFIRAGIDQPSSVDLEGGGLVRSAGGWEAVRELRRGREVFLSDERVLGDGEFVQSVLKEVRNEGRERYARSLTAVEVVSRVCHGQGITAEALRGGGRSPMISRVREGAAYAWLDILGRSASPLAELLGVTVYAVYKAAKRGARQGGHWKRVLEAPPPQR